MANNNSSEPKPVKDTSQRTLKKIGEIDTQAFVPNNTKEIDFYTFKKQKSEKWQIYVDSNTEQLRLFKTRWLKFTRKLFNSSLYPSNMISFLLLY